MTSSVQPQVIIAMKGRPCTGKTTMAMFLSDEFNCPLIKHDDVRSAFSTLRQPPPTFQSTAAEQLNNLSFEVICQTAEVQLSLGLSVVVDSSLSRRAHLDHLLQLSTQTGARLVVVECMPRDKLEWKKRLERQGAVESGSTSWYKPSQPDDLLLEEFEGCSIYDDADVSKLMVDTTAHVHKRSSHAVSRLSICKQIHCVDFTEWLHSGFGGLEGEEDFKPPVPKELPQTKEEKRSTHMHHFRFSNVVVPENDERFTCRKCLELISGPFYNCVLCDLSLHKSCAESHQKEQLKPFDCLPFLDPNSLKYSFPEIYRCRFHLDADDEGYYFSYDDCARCLFETHLKCSMLPTVLHHDFHDTPLFLFILPSADDFVFCCVACGEQGKDALYGCNHCNFLLHVNCALLPLTLNNNQCHKHTLTLTRRLKVENVLEQHCNACEKRRDPRFWVYDCKQCVYTSHLSCVVPVKLNMP